MRLQDIATKLNGTLTNNSNVDILGISSPKAGKINTLAVAGTIELLKQLIDSPVSALVIDKAPEHALLIPFILVDNCQLALITLLELFAPPHVVKQERHPSFVAAPCAQISNRSEIGPNVVIGKQSHVGDNTQLKANIVIGNNVQIGQHCIIHPNVTVYDNTKIGNNVIIHAGTVIGADGFGYHFHDGKHQKLHHLGNVIIDDDVEIGANTTIDRGTLGSTHIGSGTKIDNLVQVAHNVTLGKNNILCAYTGIAGSVTAGDNVIFAADVGIGDHVTIADNVTLGPRTGIPSHKKLSSGTTWLGNPGRPIEKAIEQIVSIQRIPGIKKQLKKLQAQMKKLTGSGD